MAKTMQEWIDSDVAAVRSMPLRWLSEHYFFRDPARPAITDTQFFFAPADGILLYQERVPPDAALVDIKGKSYSLKDAMREPGFDRECLVIGVFMTFMDVHINRIPFPGRLCYKELEQIGTRNEPMLEIEQNLLNDLRLDLSGAGYLHTNQRMLNRVYAPALGQSYYLLQIADYDVNCIMPFQLKQNRPFGHNQRFSQIRYGSQVDLIVPLSERFEFIPLLSPGTHVEAGVDRLIRIESRNQERSNP